MSEAGYNISGVVLGGLGGVGVVQMVYSWVYYNLPSQRMQLLDDTLHETNAQFRSVIEEGLLQEMSFTRRMENRLLTMRNSAEELRTQVHCATDVKKQCIALVSGLSHAINQLRSEVEEVRAEISATSDRERKQLESEGFPTRPALYATAPTAANRSSYLTRRRPIYRVLPSQTPEADERPDPLALPFGAASVTTSEDPTIVSTTGKIAVSPPPAQTPIATPAVAPSGSKALGDSLDVTVGDERLQLSCFSPNALVGTSDSTTEEPQSSGNGLNTTQVSPEGAPTLLGPLTSPVPPANMSVLMDSIQQLSSSVSVLTTAVELRRRRRMLAEAAEATGNMGTSNQPASQSSPRPSEDNVDERMNALSNMSVPSHPLITVDEDAQDEHTDEVVAVSSGVAVLEGATLAFRG